MRPTLTCSLASFRAIEYSEIIGFEGANEWMIEVGAAERAAMAAAAGVLAGVLRFEIIIPGLVPTRSGWRGVIFEKTIEPRFCMEAFCSLALAFTVSLLVGGEMIANLPVAAVFF